MKNNSLLLLAMLLGAFAGTMSAQKRVSILGDSYSTFYGYVQPSGNQCWYGVPGTQMENDVTDVRQTWWHQLADSVSYIIECNNSYSGATVCNTGYEQADYTDRSFLTRMTDLGNPDIILVFGGTNDTWAGVPLGEFKYAGWTKDDLYEFRPAFCHLMDFLLVHYPNARVYNITNTELTPEVTSAMAEVCSRYGITNIVLHDIDKQWGHPSVKGMESICRQVKAALDED